MSPPLAPIPRRKTSHDPSGPILVTRIPNKRAATASPEAHEPARKLTKVVRHETSTEALDGEDKVVTPAAKKEPARSHRNDEVSFDEVFKSQLGDKVVTARTASLKALYDALARDSTARESCARSLHHALRAAVWPARTAASSR